MKRNEYILCSLSRVLEACGPPEWTGSDLIRLTVARGTIPFSLLRELEQCDVFVDSLFHARDTALQSRYDSNVVGDISFGSNIVLRLPRVVDRAVVAKNLADLLALPSGTWQEPRAYFLIAEEESGQPYCFTGEAPGEGAPARIRRYHHAVQLWTLLQDQAEHITPTQSLLFFGLRRIEIVPRYEVDDLNEEITLTEIREFVKNPDRQKTRIEIFRSVLSELIRDQKPERAFSYLLRTSSLFARRLREGLTIYLAAHSPERLAEEATAKHLELAERLEKIISGIEAKSLSIPAAVLLAIKEVKLGEAWTTINTIILAAALLYLVAMTVAHFSQRALLNLLKSTILKTTKDLRDQGLEEANPVLSVAFSNLSKRRRHSSLGSWMMWAFSWVPVVAVLYAAFVAEQPPGPGPNKVPIGGTNSPGLRTTSPPLASGTTNPAPLGSNLIREPKPTTVP